MMIDWIFTFLIINYCLFIVYLWLGWERIPIISNENETLSVCVIIPIRNEAVNIITLLNDLKNQIYDNQLYVLIVDDHSEDESERLIKESIKGFPNFRLISLIETEGKKAALTKGIENTNAEIILTIDGDCRAPTTWVNTMVNAFSTATQFVSGPVKFNNEDGFFKKMQQLEFTSLIGSGASLIGWNKPIMANGANMGFRRKAFLEVRGFDGNERTASGDDVFLLHKMADIYPNSIEFVKQKGAIVETKSQPTFKAFMQQRIRWASKWKAYTDLFTKTTALLIFIVSLSLLVFPFLVVFNRTSIYLWANLMVIKSFFEFFLIRQIAHFLEDKINLKAFIILQLIYPLYVVFTALFSIQKLYYWKGRLVK